MRAVKILKLPIALVIIVILLNDRIVLGRAFGVPILTVGSKAIEHGLYERAINATEMQDPQKVTNEERLVVVTTSGAMIDDGEKKGDVLRIGDVFSVTEEREELLFVTSVGGWVQKLDVLAYDDAVKYFNAAIKKDPKNAIAHFGKGNLFLWMALNNRWSFNSEEGAIFVMPSDILGLSMIEFDEAVSLEPNNADFIKYRTQSLMKMQNLEDAIADIVARFPEPKASTKTDSY